MIIVHELLHLLIAAGKGDLYVFYYKEGFALAVHADCELTWTRSFIYRIFPFAVLTVGFFVISLFIGGTAGGFLNTYTCLYPPS